MSRLVLLLCAVSICMAQPMKLPGTNKASPAPKAAAKPAAKATTFDQDVRLLLKLTEVEESAMAMVQQMGMLMKMANQQIPDDAIIAEMKKVNTSGFTNAVVPVYKKYFTQAEVKEMIRFYSSPVGKKMAQKLPLITQDAMASSQGWAEGEAKKMKAALEKKGYKFPTAPAGAKK